MFEWSSPQITTSGVVGIVWLMDADGSGGALNERSRATADGASPR
jgi:hypothetical protein